MASRMLQVFLNADLRCSHEGLAALAKEHGIDVHNLAPGEFIAFINAGKDRIKLYASSDVIAYLKLSRGKLMMETISKIPQAFLASGKIDYDKALKDALYEALTKRRRLDLEIIKGGKIA